jgi:hypothetical protein
MRFGGLSLGESWAMVNGIRVYREEDGTIRWLVKNNRGLISLPVWINRETGQGTFQRFDWGSFSDDCWVTIQAPEAVETTRASEKRDDAANAFRIHDRPPLPSISSSTLKIRLSSLSVLVFRPLMP